MFKARLVFFLLPLVLLTGCTFDNEYEEKAVLPPPPPKFDKPVEEDFVALSHRCIIRGDKADADLLDEMYRETMKPGSDSTFANQTEERDLLHSKCMQKVAHVTGDHDYIDKIVVNPFRIAYVAREFYIRDDEQNGAYWLRRLVNLQGISNGYFTAGSFFIRDRKTLKTGAQLLAESAHQGNQNAIQLLTQLNSVQTTERQIFRNR